MCSPSPVPRSSLASILVRSERRVDWRRRSSLAESVSDDDDAAGKHLNNDDDNVPTREFHNTNDEESNGTTCRTAFSITTTKVTFAPTIKQRRIPGLADMDKEEIASLWRTPIDRSQCTSHIADTVRVVRTMKQSRNQGIGGNYDESMYCERGIEVYIDEKYKQKLMHKRKLIAVSVLSKQEELRNRNFDPTQKDAKFSHEKELANLATTISRDSVKSARIRAKRDLFAARGVGMNQHQQQPPPSSSSSSSSPSSPSTTARFGGMTVAARSLSWNRRNALSALKRDNSRRYREQQQFVGHARQMSSISDDGSDSSRKSSQSGTGSTSRCRAAKMA